MRFFKLNIACTFLQEIFCVCICLFVHIYVCVCMYVKCVHPIPFWLFVGFFQFYVV